MKTPPPKAARAIHHGVPRAMPMPVPVAETNRTARNSQSRCQGSSKPRLFRFDRVWLMYGGLAEASTSRHSYRSSLTNSQAHTHRGMSVNWFWEAWRHGRRHWAGNQTTTLKQVFGSRRASATPRWTVFKAG